MIITEIEKAKRENYNMAAFLSLYSGHDGITVKGINREELKALPAHARMQHAKRHGVKHAVHDLSIMAKQEGGEAPAKIKVEYLRKLARGYYKDISNNQNEEG